MEEHSAPSEGGLKIFSTCGFFSYIIEMLTYILTMLEEQSGHRGVWASAKFLIVGFYKHLFALSYSLPQ